LRCRHIERHVAECHAARADAQRRYIGVQLQGQVLEMPPALAVNVAACAVVTDETEAVNAALVALAATVTVAGTLTAALLLDRLTLNPPLGATALSDIVQASLPAPVMDVLLHEIALNPAVVDGVPVPLRLTPTVGWSSCCCW